MLLCVATGFVYFATADFVANYDFSGYREVLRKYLKRGPILRSVGLITLFIVTLVAAVANVLFYLNLASRFGVVLFILAGVMLWFACFVVMTFVLAMPLVAQRDLTVWQAIRSGAVMALARPVRTLVVAVTASVIFVLGLMSGAGAGFFAVSAPTALFNAAAKVSLDEAEGRTPGEPELPVGTATRRTRNPPVPKRTQERSSPESSAFRPPKAQEGKYPLSALLPFAARQRFVSRRRAFPRTAATARALGLRMSPFSVIIAVMYLCGVTSNAGLHTSTP